MGCGETSETTMEATAEIMNFNESEAALTPVEELDSVAQFSEEPVTDTAQVAEKASQESFDMDWEEYEASMTKDFSFVILISTESYESALERAHDASEKLGYPIDLRGHRPHVESGLTVSKEVCEEDICGGGVVDYPLYLPRNDWGDSKYISVEYSNGYEGFNPGYYIVILASAEKGDPIIQEALDEARKYYQDAYAKTCGIWVGCQC